MKTEYVTPEATKVDFCYDEQVVASGGCKYETLTSVSFDSCTSNWDAVE